MKLKFAAALVAGAMVFFTAGCAAISRHIFAEPARDWEATSGQLLYQGAKTSLIGEVLVRYSKNGDLELTFTKGPGVTLLMIRQDAAFVRVTGPLARGSWSGAPKDAPQRLRGWIALRAILLREKGSPVVRHTAGAEKFTFRF